MGESPLSDADLRARVAAIRWYHPIELRPGLVTPGGSRPSAILERMRLPDRLDGRSVLDIGAWDGYFSFEAERRGAARVLAADSFAWSGENWSSKAGFELARATLGSRVEDADVDVMDLSPERVGVFDLVLFLGVLYHLRHPLLALERVASVTGDQLILETHVDLLWARRPAMAFYPGQELSWDPTNWWGPNPAAVIAMLRVVGFRRVELVTPDSWAYRVARMGRRAISRLRDETRGARGARGRGGPAPGLLQGRAVFHAFK